MFLSSHLNLNSSPVGVWGLETGNGSVSLFMLNNKKLNCLKSASQGEFFFSSLNLVMSSNTRNFPFFLPLAWGQKKHPRNFGESWGYSAWHATSLEFRSLLPTTKLPALLLGKRAPWGGCGRREWVEY